GEETLALDGERVELAIVSMGNPHAVQVVADVERAPVTTQGPRLERHARFPQGVNAGYMQVRERHRIALRVWERGAGETLSCGTGAGAAVVAGVALREKARVLEGRLGELISNAAQNDAISEKVHRLTVALVGARDFPALARSLYFHLREDFAVPHVALRVWGKSVPVDFDEARPV